MRIPLALLVIATALLATNCISNQEDLTAPITIDPISVSYANDIQPILTQTCGGGACHVNNSQNGVNVSDYNALMSSVGTNYGGLIVEPGSPDQSPLVDKIEPNPQFGSRMPLSRGPLSPEQISLIRAWIQGGAENN